jgi:NAD(P)-dependent dehydrogenase (short-subunit alcohol dehydrogenase family)/rhamnose utilization protein RhaD (predicted bifunctional aldolase and dehydrogenase)
MHIAELLEPETLARELNDLIEAAHALCLDDRHVLPGSSSISAKLDATDALGRKTALLFINRSDEKLGTIQGPGFLSFYNKRLLDLTAAGSLEESLIGHEIAASQVPPYKTGAAPSALLHAAVPLPFVFFTQPAALMAMASCAEGAERLRELYGERMRVLPFRASGPALACELREAFETDSGARSASGLFVMQQGLITFGATAAEALQSTKQLEAEAGQYLEEREAWSISISTTASTAPVPRAQLAALRKALSDAAGSPLILRTDRTAEGLSLVEAAQSKDLLPVLPAHLTDYKYSPLVGHDVLSYAAKNGGGATDPAPRIILDQELGLCAAGFTAGEAAANADFFCAAARISQRATQLGPVVPLSVEAFDRERHIDGLVTAAEPARAKPVFTGEVALVTGAASGIGKACARSFLERGAAVVGLDISPSIVSQFPGEAFLGLVCDVSDEGAVRSAVDQTALAFGGLDMLVLNAGIFPAGCRIDAMDMAEWEKVISINLSGNMALMRETFALLKLAPRHGRVVINGSRNVKAPGPGASAYSASKAALTQLARVAALEWGKDGIRVNVVHPNAVFDTALYTEEVLKARAASYGITVEQYKKNNVLQVEITSRDVAEMAAEMCGPLFAKVTGAQVSIDGGSDRVI